VGRGGRRDRDLKKRRGRMTERHNGQTCREQALKSGFLRKEEKKNDEGEHARGNLGTFGEKHAPLRSNRLGVGDNITK